MNWGAIGAISDILAAFAVVISLVYLSVQIQSAKQGKQMPQQCMRYPLQQILRVWEEACLMRESGRLNDEMWIPMDKQQASFMGSPAVFYVWNIRKECYNDEFREYTDSCNFTDYKV